MIDNNSKNNTLDDRQLSQLMKKELPAAPANPWFTRKVMNRLPAKGPHIYSWIEYTAYAIALVALIVFWCIFYNDIKESGKLTIDDMCGDGCAKHNIVHRIYRTESATMARRTIKRGKDYTS